jgi:hypothetical protein
LLCLYESESKGARLKSKAAATQATANSPAILAALQEHHLVAVIPSGVARAFAFPATFAGAQR